MYIGALKFLHSYFNVYVARVAPLGFIYTCLRSAPALLDLKKIWEKGLGTMNNFLKFQTNRSKISGAIYDEKNQSHFP